MEYAKSWVQDCLSKHDICNADHNASLGHAERPKRVLELTIDRDTVLRQSSELSQPFLYVTLSHMWGAHPEQQLQLSQSRLEEFQTAIPEEELSEVYRTAIKMTLDLGYRYLWIDSLCILQDSSEDWSSEATRMGVIYRNAVCSLSFLYPPEMGVNPLHDRRAKSPCIFRRATLSGPGLIARPSPAFFTKYGNFQYGKALLPKIEHWGKYWEWLDWTKWPLFSRAWVLQERLLCRRHIVVIGYDHLLFECSEYQCDELIGQLREEHYPHEKVTEPTKKSFSALQYTEHPLDSFVPWFETIYCYRAKRLTRESDRIIAHAGVARVFETTNRLTYLAGMFLEHMPHTLLWHGDKFAARDADSVISQELGVDKIEALDIKAPSWSWFALPTQVEISNDNITYDDTMNVSIFLPPTPAFSWLGHEGNDRPDTSFHDFTGLRLVLEVPTFSAIASIGRTKDAITLRQSNNLLLNNTSLLGQEIFWVPDTRSEDLESSIDAVLTVLRVYEPYTTHRHVIAEGLILIAGEESNAWQRIGWWSNEVSFDQPDDFKHLLELNKRTLTLV